MQIRSQIIIAQVPTAIIIVLITFFFIFTLTVMNYKTESILVDNFKNILSMERLNNSAEELNNYFIHPPPNFKEQIKIVENKMEKEILFQEKNIEEIKDEQNEAVTLTHALRKKWEDYQESLHILPLNKKSEILYKELKEITNTIISLNQDDIIRKKDDLSNFIIEYRLFISFSSLVGLIFGFFMSWIFTGLFLAPLKKMTEMVSQFGKTDETTLLHLKGSEEIEKLSNEFNLMTSRLEEYHQSSLGHIIDDYENLKRVFDAFPEPLLIFNDNNDISHMNIAADRLFRILGNSSKKKTTLFYIDPVLRESLLNIIKDVFLTKKIHIPKKMEKPMVMFKKNKKIFILPFAYPIKNINHIHSNITNVLMLLHDPTHHSVSDLETAQNLRTFILNFQAPLIEIQLAVHTILQEGAGPLTEIQKDILYAARDKCAELSKIYQNFRKISQIDEETG